MWVHIFCFPVVCHLSSKIIQYLSYLSEFPAYFVNVNNEISCHFAFPQTALTFNVAHKSMLINQASEVISSGFRRST